MILPINLTMYKRPVAAPLLNRFADHTYVQGIDPAAAPPANMYNFTCYDHRINVVYPEPGDVVVRRDPNGMVAAIPSTRGVPVIVATNNLNLNAPPPVPAARQTYNQNTDRYGMKYLRHGVCHQAANRCLLNTGVLADFTDIKGGRLSLLLYNHLGTINNQLLNAVRIYRIYPGPLNIPIEFGRGNERYDSSFHGRFTGDTACYLQSLYEMLMKNASSDFSRELIKLNFNCKSSKKDNDDARFFLFMEDTFTRRFDASYATATEGEIENLYKAYQEFLRLKETFDKDDNRDIDTAYIGEFNSALRAMLKQFYIILGHKRYVKLVDLEYCEDFTFLPEDEPMYKKFYSK